MFSLQLETPQICSMDQTIVPLSPWTGIFSVTLIHEQGICSHSSQGHVLSVQELWISYWGALSTMVEDESNKKLLGRHTITPCENHVGPPIVRSHMDIVVFWSSKN